MRKRVVRKRVKMMKSEKPAGTDSDGLQSVHGEPRTDGDNHLEAYHSV